jgi:hypothetical protein
LSALKRQGGNLFFKFFTMKKIEIKGKLSLNKSTIATLDAEQMNLVKGGEADGFLSIGKCKRSRGCTVSSLNGDCPF